MTTHRYLHFPSLALPLIMGVAGACGSAPADDPGLEPDSNAQDDGVPVPDSAAQKVSLCGSDDSVGFIAASGGGGLMFPGTEVLTEIGASYVAVSTTCEFWSYSSFGPRGAPGGILRKGRLTQAQVRELEQLLQLEAWASLESVHGVCCYADSGVVSYSWGADTVSWVALGSPAPLPEAFPVDLSTLLADTMDLLSGAGQPATGPVRYTVLPVEESSNSEFALAPPWPLETPVAEVASDFGSPGVSIEVHRAEGEDAAKLRVVRSAARNGAFGFLTGGHIAIKEPDGSRYHLFVRDVAEFESPEGAPERDPLRL